MMETNPFEIIGMAGSEDVLGALYRNPAYSKIHDILSLAYNLLWMSLYPCPYCDGTGRDYHTNTEGICPECYGWGMDTSISPSAMWDMWDSVG